MQELAQALEEARALHRRVFGRPAPELGPTTFLPFPAGVDPPSFALRELRAAADLAERAALARPDAWVPPADCFATKREVVVRIEVPGISREDLNVSVANGECVVRGERKAPRFGDEARPLAIERAWGTFERRFVVPVGCDVEAIDARVADGVLELRFPLEELEIPEERKVDVS